MSNDAPVIKRIGHFGMCEDGQTFMLMCDTADGRTLIVSACPGEALAVHLDGDAAPDLRRLNS
jgi:hypothetical protein